jgi:hypothetical protein
MEYFESIGFTTKILKMFFAQIKKSKIVKKSKKNFRLACAVTTAAPLPLTEICAPPTDKTKIPRKLKFWLPEFFRPTPGQLVKVFEIFSRNGFHGLKMVLSCSEGMI